MHFEHIPADLIAHQICGVARCDAIPLITYATREHYTLDAARIACPARIVGGTAERLLPWPSAAARFRDNWLPQTDWVQLEGIGHRPQLDIPLVTAQLILGVSSRRRRAAAPPGKQRAACAHHPVHKHAGALAPAQFISIQHSAVQ